MSLKTCIAGAFLALVLAGCGGSKDGKQCITREPCVSDPNCMCWCSQICEYRKKTSEDNPKFVDNDPNGKFCYCKQWDYDNFKDNCVQNKHNVQPAGAQ